MSSSANDFLPCSHVQPIYSYTMLTINAEHHPLLRLMHKPADEKRMVVILAEDD